MLNYQPDVTQLLHRPTVLCRVVHAARERNEELNRGLLLDVVVQKGAAVIELLTPEDQHLLFRRNALSVRDLVDRSREDVCG